MAVTSIAVLGSDMKLYIEYPNIKQAMNIKLIFTAIAIVATFSIAVTAITTNVSAQNMTGGNMSMSAGDNMTTMANNLTMEMDDKYTTGG